MKLITVSSALLVAAFAAGCTQNADQPNVAASTNQASPYNTNSAAAATDTNVDNTKVNARDRNSTNLTALDQGNAGADTMLSASIRKMVVSSNNNFSMTAQNIKIIAQNGKVTLRGPVNTEGEKMQIETIAKGVAGDGNVENDLEVKANP